jgi:hypothetical protein
MVLKFITAGVISAILAGGAMYLAMDDEMLAQLRAEAQRVRMSETVPELRRGPETPVNPEIDVVVEDQEETDSGSVVDRLLGRDGVSHDIENPDIDESTATDTAPVSPESRVGRRVEEPSEKRGWLDDFLPRRETVESPLPVRRESDAPPPADPAVFDALMEQAALVGIVDARDDAYFNILNFALTEGRYDVADGLIENLSTPELRDTARQRIGISHAQAGRMDKAFAVMDGVEIDALSDPIRLEIIRSVTTPR